LLDRHRKLPLHIIMKTLILYPLIVILFLAAGCSDSNRGWFSSGDEDSQIPENRRYHTPDAPGIWQGREAEHTATVVFTSKNTIEVTVPLLPSAHPKHYIESIMLMKNDKLVEAKRFEVERNIPKATFKLDNPSGTEYWISIKCNNHGLWKAGLPENPFLE
jgi:desulfoferrodoxin (superoxide reductase-like protein)